MAILLLHMTILIKFFKKVGALLSRRIKYYTLDEADAEIYRRKNHGKKNKSIKSKVQL